MNNLSLFIVRLSIAMSFFGHGIVRLPKLSVFALSLAKSFETTLLPQSLVLIFGYILPFLELGIGVLLLLGLWTRFVALCGAVVLVALIFGSSLLEQWSYIQIQLIHIAFLAALAHFGADKFSLDSIFKRQKGK